MKNLTSIFFILAFMLQLQAQNSKVTSGVIAFESGRYEEALEKLTIAIDNIDELKEKNIPKAHYYLSQTYLRIGQDSALIQLHPDALLKSYDHLEKALETDSGGKYKKQATLANQMLWPAIFNAGAVAYNQEEYRRSLDHFKRAVALSPEDINSLMMLGYSQWMIKDTTAAIDSWKKTVEEYEANLPEEPNKDIAAAYLLLGTLYDLRKNTTEALSIVQKGRIQFPDDTDLQRTELSIYQQNPQLLGEAEAKFKKAIADNPDDLVVQLAYAGMLQDNEQMDKALELYHGVLAKDPQNLQANLQIGAYYVNKAAELNEEKMKLTNDDEINEAAKAVETSLKEAFPYIERLHGLQPDEPEWINQLVTISLYLGMDESTKYIEKQKEIMEKRKQGN